MSNIKNEAIKDLNKEKRSNKIINRDYLLAVLNGYYTIKPQQACGCYLLKRAGIKYPVASLGVAGGQITITFK